jgi:hypothetical protein
LYSRPLLAVDPLSAVLARYYFFPVFFFAAVSICREPSIVRDCAIVENGDCTKE